MYEGDEHHEEARKIELHDAGSCLDGSYFLKGLNLLVVELQARIVGPQQLHVVMAAEDAQGNETVISMAYHGSFTVWWVDWSPDLEVHEEGCYTKEEWLSLPPVNEKPEGFDLVAWSEKAERHEEDQDANDHPL